MTEPPHLLAADGLVKTYHRGTSFDRRLAPVRALDGVDLTLAAGTFTLLVGPSGGGKSTLGRCLALLETPDAGRVLLDGDDVSRIAGERLRRARRQVQLVFQDPAAAIDPRYSVHDALAEPLEIGGLTGADRDRRIDGLLAEVELQVPALSRRALGLSGGQLQRLALARALATGPRLLILDETLSGLDLSLRARMANLLLDLRRRHGLTCLLVTHDPAFGAHLADAALLIAGGKIVHRLSRQELWSGGLARSAGRS